MARVAGGAGQTPGTGGGPPRRDSTVDRLATITRDVQLRLADTWAASGDHGLRPSFAPLLQLLWEHPRPIGALAVELRVSAQAAGRSSATLERSGYVDRTTNEEDRRSKLVSLTPRGRRLLDQAGETLAGCELHYAELVGSSLLDRLLADLDQLREGLQLSADSGALLQPRARRSIGAMILLSLEARRTIARTTVARGHPRIRGSHLELLAIVGPGGARVSDMARAQRVTRQAVSTTVQELEALGYLGRRPDDHDGRGVVFSLTARGIVLAGDTLAALDAVEHRYQEILGAPRFDRFEQGIGALRDAIVRTGGPSPASDRHWTVSGIVTAAGRGDGASDGGGGGRVAASEDRQTLERLARRLRDELGPRRSARLSRLLIESGSAAGRPAVHDDERSVVP